MCWENIFMVLKISRQCFLEKGDVMKINCSFKMLWIFWEPQEFDISWPKSNVRVILAHCLSFICLLSFSFSCYANNHEWFHLSYANVWDGARKPQGWTETIFFFFPPPICWSPSPVHTGRCEAVSPLHHLALLSAKVLRSNAGGKAVVPARGHRTENRNSMTERESWHEALGLTHKTSDL